ncbi:hypothetical protein BGX21_005188 [Mortierella sp. AD011]|nr:hypothetical protein BGX21_005188 [Mortierella sp. AD011]
MLEKDQEEGLQSSAIKFAVHKEMSCQSPTFRSISDEMIEKRACVAFEDKENEAAEEPEGGDEDKDDMLTLNVDLADPVGSCFGEVLN